MAGKRCHERRQGMLSASVVTSTFGRMMLLSALMYRWASDRDDHYIVVYYAVMTLQSLRNLTFFRVGRTSLSSNLASSKSCRPYVRCTTPLHVVHP